MKIYYWPFIILISQAHAVDIKSIESNLKSINPSAIECSTMSIDELSLQCAHSICGKPENHSIVIDPKDTDKYLSEESHKKFAMIETQLREHLQLKQKEYAEFEKEFEKRLANKDFEKISKLPSFQKNILAKSLLNNTFIQTNQSAPINERRIILDKDKNNSPFIQEIAKNLTPLKDPILSFEIGLINSFELLQIISHQIDEFKMKSLNIKLTGNFSIDDFKSFTESSLGYSPELEVKFNEFLGYSSNNKIDIIGEVCSKNCLNEIETRISSFKNNSASKIFQDKMNLFSTEDRLAQCKAAFLNSHAENTKKIELAKLWNDAKSDIKEQGLKPFSEHSRKMISEYLDNEINLIYNAPLAPEYRDPISALNNSSPSYEDLTTDGILLKAFNLEEEISDMSFSCRPVPTSKVWDMYASKEAVKQMDILQERGFSQNQDNIVISPWACEHQKAGKSIIAHEVGHAISHIMKRKEMSTGSKKTYLKTRDCVTQKWATETRPLMEYHKGDTLYTEEDMADVFSYMTYNQPESIYSCVLLGPINSKYTALSLEINPLDNHTPGLIRLLRELSYKTPNKIPETCSELIKRNQHMVGNKCL